MRQVFAPARRATNLVLHSPWRRALALLLMLLLVGCGLATPEAPQPFIRHASTAPASGAEAARPKTIALVMKTLTNPFFIEMERGARQAEHELGIQLIVKTAAQETSIEQQIAIVEELIQAHVDAIVIAPGDSVGLIPVLKKAQDAGVVIVNIDNQLDPDRAAQAGLKRVPFISVDNEQGAYLSTKYISDQIHSPAEAIILEGIRTARNAQDRKNGALRAFGGNPNIKVVAMETAHWKIDEAYDVTRQLFSHYPDIRAVFAANDMMALGAAKYLAEIARPDVLVAGFDALPDAESALRSKALAVSIDQQAAQQGNLGVHYAARMIAGETVPAETMIDVLVVNANTLH